jgi:hypothetical protein
MATQTIKTTYALDVETVRTLENLARRWSVSKSEALRRAIRASGSSPPPARELEPLEALDRLQQALQLQENDASRWERAVQTERKAGSRRRESRLR